MKNRKIEEAKTVESAVTPELQIYRETVKLRSVLGQKITALQQRSDQLAADSVRLHEELTEARQRKDQGIEKLALGEIDEATFDEIKNEIKILAEKIGEVSEQQTIIEKKLRYALEREIPKAGLDVSNARFNAVAVHVAKEAEELRNQIGGKVNQLTCLSGYMGINNHGAMLARIFPDLPFSDRVEISSEQIKKIFNE